jgi:hypothetical protein
MKIKTNVYAGMTLEECQAARDWWKQQANMMEGYAHTYDYYPPAGLWFPCMGNPPVSGGSGGSSGGGTTPPPTAGGGYVAGVWVTDMSGTCV